MSEKPLSEQLFPSIDDIFGDLGESVNELLVDPLDIVDELELSPKKGATTEETIEIINEAEEAIQYGKFDRVKELLEEGEQGTNCGWCKDKIKRVKLDVDYVEDVCIIDEDSECQRGLVAVATKLDHMSTTLQRALELKQDIKKSSS